MPVDSICPIFVANRRNSIPPVRGASGRAGTVVPVNQGGNNAPHLKRLD